MKESMIELIDKFKKNSKLSIADNEEFENELASELNEGVYTEDIESILSEGPVESSMKVFAHYLSHIELEKANPFIKKFIRGKRISDNKGGVSGMRIVFLYKYLFDEYDSHNMIIEKAFNALVRFAYKNGKDETNKKIVDLLRKNIIPLLANKSKEIELNISSMEVHWEKTRDLFFEAVLEEDKINSESVQRVYYWLKSANRDMGKYTEDYLRNQVMENNDLKSETQPKENKKSFDEESKGTPADGLDSKNKTMVDVKKNNKDTADGKMKNQHNATVKIVESMVSVVIASAREITSLKSEINYLKQKTDELQSQFTRMASKQVQQEDTIQELDSEKMKLQKQNNQYAEKISELEKLIEKQKSEINDRKQFTDTVARNREKQSEEQLNKLASKLRVDYRDFCDAKDIDMSIDLGENMREQLGAVFSILEKSGIKLN